MTDIEAAAERRRSGYPRASASGGADYDSYYLHIQEYRDENALADAYVRELDPAPATEKFFESLGYQYQTREPGFVYMAILAKQGDDGRWTRVQFDDDYVEFYVSLGDVRGTRLVLANPTVGQVLTALRLFGITPKETTCPPTT